MRPVFLALDIRITPIYGSFDDLKEIQGVDDDDVATTLDRAFPKVTDVNKRHVIKVMVDDTEMSTSLFADYVIGLRKILKATASHEIELYKKIVARNS